MERRAQMTKLTALIALGFFLMQTARIDAQQPAASPAAVDLSAQYAAMQHTATAKMLSALTRPHRALVTKLQDAVSHSRVSRSKAAKTIDSVLSKSEVSAVSAIEVQLLAQERALYAQGGAYTYLPPIPPPDPGAYLLGPKSI
jgi:hypothetical protein